jgi:hypothetical protein
MNRTWIHQQLVLDGKSYDVAVSRQEDLPPSEICIAVVSYLPNRLAVDILLACVRSIREFTATPVELWVVDNASERVWRDRLLSEPGLNLAFNLTPPSPPGVPVESLLLDPMRWGSYANAVGLEIVAALIDPGTSRFCTFHMDTMATHPAWLDYLLGKIHGRVAAAGVRMDRTRVADGVLHVLGMVFDFQLFRKLGLTFYPRLPQFDVGDLVTIGVRRAGYDVYACRNTLWEPELVQSLPESSPFKGLAVDRSLDDEGNVIFLHLGRGLGKATGKHTHGVAVADWLKCGTLLCPGKEVVDASIG